MHKYSTTRYWYIIVWSNVFSLYTYRHCLHVHYRRPSACEGISEQASRHPCQRLYSILLVCCHHLLHPLWNCKFNCHSISNTSSWNILLLLLLVLVLRVWLCILHMYTFWLYAFLLQYFGRRNPVPVRVLIFILALLLLLIFLVSFYYFHNWKWSKSSYSHPHWCFRQNLILGSKHGNPIPLGRGNNTVQSMILEEENLAWVEGNPRATPPPPSY